MIAIFVLVSCFAVAMTAPPTATNETLRALLNPTPEVMEKLNKLGSLLDSAAASHSAMTSPEMGVGAQLSNLNLLGGLNGIIGSIVKGILDKLSRPETPAQPAPTNPAGNGNDVFTQPGVNMPPRFPIQAPFNPFSFMFPGGSNPMSMIFPSMMFDMFEGIF